MDLFSPVAPAHIRVLVLPVGKIERSRFLGILRRLRDETSIIKLADVEHHIGDNELLLSPKAFPQGSLLYNYTTSVPSQQQQQLSPFELFRDPLIVLGIVDGLKDSGEDKQKELGAAADYLRERHLRVVHRQLLILEEAEDENAGQSDSIIFIRNANEPRTPSLNEAICQSSARFLTELTTYTRAMQASPSIQTPGQTARSLQRTTSHREPEKQLGSGRSTPTHGSEVSSPVDDSGSRPPPLNRGPPATSFDQIQVANSVPTVTARPESQASNKSKHGPRASSQDRVPVQGFGSGTSAEKLKQRGKARVGIVIGSIHLMAGQWSEALRILVENTNKARMLSDYLWHAKGLESIVVCLLLHSWAGLEFQIPSICYPIIERTASAHVQRFSVNLQQDFRPADGALQASMKRLSTSLPDLLKLILSLYRSGEGSLELPFVAVSEVTIRFCKLLGTLYAAAGELNQDLLDHLIVTRAPEIPEMKPAASFSGSTNLSKGAIADMLSHAQPMGEDSVAVTDKVAILTGIVSVYALLGMARKKAVNMKDLFGTLTGALTLARKRGAAEMGIHPAASLSADTGTEAVLAVAEDSGGISQAMSELASIYGIQLLETPMSEPGAPGPTFFGGDNLKLEVLRELAAFCEASPDLYGLLRLNTSLLRSFGPNGAVDAASDAKATTLSKDEQVRVTTTISRAIGVSKNFGLPKVEATYWDSFLVRRVEFVLPNASNVIIDRSKLKSATSLANQGNPGNLLLYDPNASRPGTAADSQQTSILIRGEVSECLVTLQNPYDVSVDVESLTLVTEGAELKTSHQPITLHATRLQQVILSVSPRSTGDCKITGCRINISGCAEQTFPVVNKAWSPSPPTLMKHLGQEARSYTQNLSEGQKGDVPQHSMVTATVIPPQPTLLLEKSSLLESCIMLLNGEEQELTVWLRNNSSVTASVFDIVTTSDALRLQVDSRESVPRAATRSETSSLAEPVVIEPGETTPFKFRLTGKGGMSKIQAAFSYGSNSSDINGTEYAHMLPVPINVTVNAALQVQNLDAILFDEDDDQYVVCFDIGNAWPRTLSFSCSVADSAERHTAEASTPKQEETLAPGEIQRVSLPMIRFTADVDFGANAETIRRALLNRLRVTWTGEGRAGEVDVSSLSLSAEALEIVRGAPVHVSLELAGSEDHSNRSLATSRCFVKVGSFASLRAKIVNRSVEREPLLVQLHSRGRSPDSAQDERRLAAAGSLHRVLPPVPVGGEAAVDFVICPLLSGIIDLEVTVKPALQKKDAEGAGWVASASLSLKVMRERLKTASR